MKSHVFPRFVVAALLAVSATAFADVPKAPESGMAVKPAKVMTYLKPDAIDFVALLPAPPAVGSLEAQSELREIKTWQTLRSKEDETRCKVEETLVVFTAFSSVLGPNFTAEQCPKAAALFDAITVDSKHFSSAAKNVWTRRRPPYIDPSLVPAAKLEDEGAYPSGHSTRGQMFAEILATIVPEKHDALIARGQEVGYDRVIAAVHYPSDVAAGRTLGHAVTRALLAEPKFQADLEAVKAEIRLALSK